MINQSQLQQAQSQPPPAQIQMQQLNKQQMSSPEKQSKISQPPQKIELPQNKNMNLNPTKEQQQQQLTKLVSSDYYSDLDRKADYDEITTEIRREGIFGLGRINMEDINEAIIARKAQIEGRGDLEQKGLRDELLSKNRPKSELDDLLINIMKNIYHNFNIQKRKDGIYITNDSKWLYGLEEQLQKQRMKDNDRFLKKLFKKNADLVIDQEFFDEKISKIRIVSQNPNPSLALKRRPAVMCERLNQNKHIPYRLRVYIGKIQLSKHYRMNKEEIQIQDLIAKVREYKERCDIALIPHYDKAIIIIERELAFLRNSGQREPAIQIEILINEKLHLERLVANEAILIKSLMDEIVDKWKQIQSIRQAQNKNHSPYRLYAKQYRNSDNGQEIEFILVKDVYTEDKEADRSEVGRRNDIRREKIFVELLVNGQEAGRSQNVRIDWPSFEIKIMEQFYILLFTRPKSMQLRIVAAGIFNKVIDIIDLEIPGDKSKTITATSQILSEIEFCQGASARRAQKLLEIENEKKKLQEKAKADEIAKEQLKQQQLDQASKKRPSKKEENKEEEGVIKQQDNNQPQEQQQHLSPEQEEEKRKEEEMNMVKTKMEQLKDSEERARQDATYRVKLNQFTIFIKGKVSVLCEWTGSGDKMPPHNIDNFGKGQATNQDLMMAFQNPDDQVKQIKEEPIETGFHFDVNDPRNELYIEKLRGLRFKDERAKVLRDIFLPFAHIDSLRERLIKCSLINPDIKSIPMLEDEIYQNSELMKLIQMTESDQAFLEDDNEQIQEENKPIFREDVAITNKEFFDKQLPETQIRIRNIKRILSKRQKFALLRKQNNRDGAPLTLKNVVNEYIIGENDIIIFELIKSCFTQQRKLQPKKKKEEKMRLQDISALGFLFHVIFIINLIFKIIFYKYIFFQ